MARATVRMMRDHRCGSGIRRYPLWAFGILPVGVVICDGWTRWGRLFRPLHCFTLIRKRSTMRDNATIVLGLWIQQRWRNESGRLASALSPFSEVILYWLRYVGDWSVSVVRSWEVSASRRFEMFYGKINQGQVSRPLYRGCPLFGGYVIRGFTVLRWSAASAS